MSTVVSRVIRSSPQRSTADTWSFIVDMLTKGEQGEKRDELLSVSGIASSIIAEQAAKDAAIVITCDGPRTRIYCLYDDEALAVGDEKEDRLGHDALKGDWAVSLPCPVDDLAWVQRALEAKSSRITARDMTQSLGSESSGSKAATDSAFTVDVDRFLKS
ncbi:hypothetical protein GLGCALEP_00851 [Pseudomonas sp. MM221]|jgi:hypothetical protein|uniref:hypothetical protein n=1 Tax=Pseudomonas mosselii TaxID=78327 RepID=UPI0022211103|nr:hypothetical protein [Pseudomonas mosselii]MDN4499547.1 hypothetical protein [Pseudomonas mosselii]CAI3793758.1 hypothetical protein DBADOPDK_00830 [Pseudomonas sp. MM223]CAI3794043.1 hypothetical protein GLGCALEP_00851 [Pseudomonas sp. MM221]